MSDCPTMRVMPWDASQGDFVEINAADFDAAVHTPYEAPAAPEGKAPRSKKAEAAGPTGEPEA